MAIRELGFAVVGTVLPFSAAHLLSVAVIIGAGDPGLGPLIVTLALLPSAFVFLLAATVALLLWRQHQASAPRAGLAILALAAAVVAAWLLPTLGRVVVLLANVAAFAVRRAARLVSSSPRLRAGSRFDLAARAGLVTAAIVLLAQLLPGRSFTQVNRLGLAASRASSSFQSDRPSAAHTDNYPPMRIVTNSLGYRDDEPIPFSGEQRVLLVGDSFVWGDGIAENAETLAAQLRGELTRRAPGRWSVATASHPGLGLYGYYRAASTLAPVLGANVVIIGYLGRTECDFFDPQWIIDRTPKTGWLRSLVIATEARQTVHQTSTLLVPLLPDRCRSRVRSLMAMFERFRQARRARLLLLVYHTDFGADDFPAGAEILRLPPELRYPGRRNEYWYERDSHPKARLDARIAELLTERLIGKRTSGSNP